MFSEHLDRLLRETPGAVSVTLMGFDGIAIDEKQVDGVEYEGDAQMAAIELGNIARQLRGISEGMGTGEVKELMVHTGGLTTVLRPVSEEYFLALSMAPGANSGKGRYLLRVVCPKLRAEL